MTPIPGRGLASGLAVTWRALTNRSVTRQYPDVQPELPPRSRGVIGLLEENCTVCMLCARECPDWCIYIDSHKETLPAPEGGRARVRNVLDRFAIDFSLCMYCGICIEVCPFEALFWSPEFAYAEGGIEELTHEKDRLREWMWTVPEPPALDSGAELPKEAGAGGKPERGRRRDQPETSAPAGAGPGPAGGERGERPVRPEAAARRTGSAERPPPRPRRGGGQDAAAGSEPASAPVTESAAGSGEAAGGSPPEQAASGGEPAAPDALSGDAGGGAPERPERPEGPA